MTSLGDFHPPGGSRRIVGCGACGLGEPTGAGQASSSDCAFAAGGVGSGGVASACAGGGGATTSALMAGDFDFTGAVVDVPALVGEPVLSLAETTCSFCELEPAS